MNETNTIKLISTGVDWIKYSFTLTYEGYPTNTCYGAARWVRADNTKQHINIEVIQCQ